MTAGSETEVDRFLQAHSAAAQPLADGHGSYFWMVDDPRHNTVPACILQGITVTSPQAIHHITVPASDAVRDMKDQQVSLA